MKNLPGKIWVSEDRTMWLHNPYSTEYTEYVRKDAFIEKAVEHIDGLIEFLNEYGHQLKKERIIENFKNYLKGE